MVQLLERADIRLRVVITATAQYAEAKKLYLETLETQKRVLGDDHPGTLRSMSNLANLYSSQGRYDEAEPLHRETLEIRRRVLGQDHPDRAASLYNLACLEAVRGVRAEALDWLRQAVDAGYAKADWMAKDSDLESLHGDPEFEAIVAEVKKRIGEE